MGLIKAKPANTERKAMITSEIDVNMEWFREKCTSIHELELAT